jgi:hypothetical protein
VPYLYWLRVYKALGLTKTHAPWVIKRLTEGIHYRKFSKDEIQQLSGTVQVSDTVIDHRARAFYFLTEEGYNRVLIEIDTHRMNDSAAVERVNEARDRIANIYTRYQQGEVLSKANEHLALPGEVAHPDYAPVAAVLEDQLAIAEVMIGIGVEPSIANTMAFSVTEDITHCGDVLTPWKNLIETDPFVSEPATLTPTDIGKAIGGMSGISINKVLIKLGYQQQIGKEWTPTQIGKPYARYVPQEIKHKSGIKRHMQLKWLPGIVEKIRSALFYEQKGQTGLFIGECGV